MEYLFRATIVFIGYMGRLEVFRKENGSYLCITVLWNQNNDKGPGTFTLNKVGKKWITAPPVLPNIVEALVEEIEGFNKQKL